MTTPDDRELIASLGRGNEWLRALLCTLARRGTLLRQLEPGRADELLTALKPWPWFKGGQFLFDLMEWEDFMVDGPPPPLMPTALDAAAWQRVAERISGIQGLFDGGTGTVGGSARRIADEFNVAMSVAAQDLPLLEPGLHLYRDVVLGLVASAGPALRAEHGGQ